MACRLTDCFSTIREVIYFGQLGKTAYDTGFIVGADYQGHLSGSYETKVQNHKIGFDLVLRGSLHA